MDKKQNLVWIDLEMTGLRPEKDTILEIALIITNSNLDILHEGPQLVIHQSDDVLTHMAPWPKEFHTKSGLVNQVKNSKISLAQAEQEVLAIIKQFCEPQTGVLCGNSIWKDRAFLYRHMPQIVEYLHYRQIDVTAFKETIARWYPNSPQAVFEKKDTHRALDDICESIAELQHFKKHFLKDSE